ncbi:MAG: hypothetical protein HFI93_06895 [Lachnospiraceae bacterium]|nr:hypothetical protein [Lachnospiraceae bacterium]
MAEDRAEFMVRKLRIEAGVQRFFGWPLALFGGGVVLIALPQISKILDVVMVLLFAVIGGLGMRLILLGNRKIKRIRIFSDYSARLAADPDHSLDFLAASAGATISEVTENVKDMLAFGLFPGAYLDVSRNRLVISNRAPGEQAGLISGESGQDRNYAMVTCRRCGAVNRIVSGTAGECEYCGSQISE